MQCSTTATTHHSLWEISIDGLDKLKETSDLERKRFLRRFICAYENECIKITTAAQYYIYVRVSSRGNHFGGGGGGGEAPGNGCGFIYFSIQLSQIWGGGGGGEASPPPPPLWMKPCMCMYVILTSVEKEGLNCLCRSIMIRRHTRTFFSFSTSRRKNMVKRRALTCPLRWSFARRW